MLDAASAPSRESIRSSMASVKQTNRSKNPGLRPGLSIRRLNDRLIFEKNRTAELIVEPCSQKIEILADALGPTSGRGDSHRGGLHE